MKKYGHIIAKLRKRQGLTQEQLGAKLNVSYQAVSKWEHDLSEPDLETIKKLSNIFNISISDFFDMIDNPELIDNPKPIKKDIKENNNFIKNKSWYLVAGLGMLIIILSLCAFLIPIKYSGKQILKKYNSSIFYLSTEGPSTTKSGTGFFINKSGLALTTYSNIKDCSNGTIRLHNGKKYDVIKVVGVDEENNIAIIQIDIQKSNPVQIGNSNDIKLENKIYSITYTIDDNLDDAESILTEGVIFKLESNSNGTTSIQTTASIDNANNGGVLFNEKGKVIGIIAEYLNVSGIGIDMVNVCIPSNYIKKINKDINLSLYDYCESLNGTYTINFDSNGATSGEMNSREIFRNYEYEIECKFSKEGYEFKGWSYNEANYGTEIYNLANTGETITLTAIWEEIKVNITYNLNGGTNDTNNIKSLKYWDENFTLLPATKKGYSFEGWFLDAEFTTPIEIINPKNDTKYALYAKFNLETYTITYELDGGINNVLNPTSYTINDGYYLYLKDAQKRGYTFEGWYDNPEFSGYKKTDIRIDTCKNIVLYAKYSVIEYRINYKSNGGSLTVEIWYSYYCAGKGTRVVDCRPSKEGYTFKGWYDNQYFNGDEIKAVSFAEGYIGDITLYAKYEAINYTISYSLNYGTPNEIANPITYTIEDDITLNPPTKPGCTFVSWYDSNSYKYLTKIEKGTTGNLYLTAKYKVNEDAHGNVVITSNVAFLEFVANQSNAYKTKNVLLETDIDLSTYSYNNTLSEFEGSFDGQNHTISHLTRPIFNKATNATIKNIHIINLDTTSNSGLILDADRCTISNCSVQGSINYSTRDYYINDCGGLIAESYGSTISECYSDVSIIYNITWYGSFSLNNYIGGIVGTGATLSNCYSRGSIEINENDDKDNVWLHIGGLAGKANINNSYSTCNIITNFKYDTYTLYIGGLVGEGNVTKSYATGNIIATFTDTTRLEYAKIASLTTSYNNENTSAIVDSYYYDEQIIDTSGTIIANKTEASMETIWTFINKNWDSSIWNLYIDKNPTLKTKEQV